ncbi:hypothetical protein EJ05DRAFT_219748 [Pseudovirgaria hyperparasitica]|uniref:Zn(2)-C6 fungal-type domain-containing protein n=1 Tax=Pseudovirgaria hyperparasitica TaxID=470096 RepID=A0A6A6VUP0_9PEZI|nr:uncharacterized protein EJ05DRAFT_219748 [Pseudovirgaria hyperparasitica]KAF2753506.1 hypothetical protein EJ05DRAFT_219748 [Pseudovirgaria hyperparasitica]
MATAVQQPFLGSALVPGFQSAHTRMPKETLGASSFTGKPHSYVRSPELTQSALPTASATKSQNSTKKKKKKFPKAKVPLEVRRSSSTPHMRAANSGETDALSPTADKRRNKLGYHRTSVACGHCRRRKIRCLLAPDDPQGRCSNCIRLKKECNFFPVEQESSQQTQSAKSDVSSSLPSASDPSSPQHIPPNVEASEEYHHYNSLSTPSSAGFRVGPDQLTNMEPSRNPTTPFPSLPHQTFPYPDANGQWNLQGFPGTFLPTGGHTQPSSNVHLAYGHQDPQHWNSTQRSMSVGDTVQQSFPQQLLSQSGYGDRPQQYYPTPLNTDLAASIPASMSGPMTAPVTMASFTQPQWSYTGGHMPPSVAHMHDGSYSGGWYNDTSNPQKIEEEGVPATTHYPGKFQISPFPR